MSPLSYRRPPPRRSDRLWWAVVLVIGVFVVAALAYRSLSSSTDAAGPESSVLAGECLPGGCAEPTATPECRDFDCAPPFISWGAVVQDAPAPEVTARGAVVLEQSCGAVIFSKDPHQRLAPASLTKIATALVAAERGRRTDLVHVNVNSALLQASNGSSVMGLQPGQTLTLRDLLYGLLLPSGNDAALAIAEYVGGSVPAFVDEMNLKVAELGLHNTHFTNPHGLDEEGLYTSAFDIAMLGRRLLSRSDLAAIVSTKTYQPEWDGPPVWNGNKLLYDYPGAVGVKTGYTAAAGQAIVAAAERDGRELIVSLLGSWDRYSDAKALFEWAFAHTRSACGSPEPPSRLSDALP